MDSLQVRREDGVLEVTLDRPKANAIDLATSRAMGEVFAGFRDDPELRVAILRTEGDRFFSAGWDLKAAAAGDPVDGDYGVGGFGGLQELPELNKPVIAAQDWRLEISGLVQRPREQSGLRDADFIKCAVRHRQIRGAAEQRIDPG